MQQRPKFVLAWIHRGGNELFPHGGMNLLVKHPSRGWEFPGGRVEKGENPEDALPLTVDLWLNQKTQEEPEVGKDAAGFQNVEIWQIIRVDPSE